MLIKQQAQFFYTLSPFTESKICNSKTNIKLKTLRYHCRYCTIILKLH